MKENLIVMHMTNIIIEIELNLNALNALEKVIEMLEER